MSFQRADGDWLGLAKYSDDQARDEHGRWMAGADAGPRLLAHVRGLPDSDPRAHDDAMRSHMESAHGHKGPYSHAVSGDEDLGEMPGVDHAAEHGRALSGRLARKALGRVAKGLVAKAADARIRSAGATDGIVWTGDWLGKYDDGQARDESGKWTAEGPHRHLGAGYNSPAEARQAADRELHTHGPVKDGRTPNALHHYHTAGDLRTSRMVAEVVRKFDEDQPRDENGRWYCDEHDVADTAEHRYHEHAHRNPQTTASADVEETPLGGNRMTTGTSRRFSSKALKDDPDAAAVRSWRADHGIAEG